MHDLIPCARKVKKPWSKVKRVHFGTLLKHLDAKPHIMKAKPPPAAAPPAMAIPLLTIEVGSSTCPVTENKAYAAIRSKL